MSSQLLLHSEDLRRLVDDGYEVAFRSNMLFVGVSYVNRQREVVRGYIVSSLSSADGVQTASPVAEHTVTFVGASGAPDDQPCNSDGTPMTERMSQPSGPIPVGAGKAGSCILSQKPSHTSTYVDYYEKMTTYASIFLTEVHVLDPAVRVQTYAPVLLDDEASVHRYYDYATSRARIGAVTDKTRDLTVAIVGIGGTGSYILDALAKTHVREIHIYDGDELQPHNAFRAPGAVPMEALAARPSKVAYHQQTYDHLHRFVTAHASRIDETNIEELRGLDFVFVSLDAGPAKKLIVEKLVEFAVPFVDTGMGIDQSGDSLGGIVRTTRVRPDRVSQDWIDERFSFATAEDDDYHQNIQIVELNMLNAALAVIAWKKHIGYYRDFMNETELDYTLDGSVMTRTGGSDDD